jgi:hypothetical protein
MKQVNLFGEDFFPKEEGKYTSKISAPLYEPKTLKPNILELLDDSKAKRLIQEITNSNISNEEKSFLIEAAKRHNIFNYEKIADYYAHSSPEIQYFMERSALVIIDFEKAIQYGFVKLSDNIKNTYLTTNENE